MLGCDETGPAALLLREYDRLKEEQLQRISTRDNLVYATLASVGAVLFAFFQTDAIDLLLLLPPGGVALGWTYLVNDHKISEIGRYIRVDLGPRAAAAFGLPGSVFRWETFHRSDRRRRSRKFIQLAVDLLIFCVPGVIAVIVRIASEDVSPVIVAILVAEITLVLILAQQITVNADLLRDGSWSAADDNAPASQPVRSPDSGAGRGPQ